MDEIVVGIDLGTTFSAIAYVDDRGQVRIICNSDGQKTTPSVALIKGGRIEVGETAMNQWVTDELHVVRWIKRAMGDNDYRFQGLSAVEISSEILKALKNDAETELGQPVTDAVITCPAYFNSIEIENTKKAGEMAGFKVREVVKEPTAAAVCYGVEHLSDRETLLVCDLGGGTYDATVLEFIDGTFLPLATMGSRELGGHDWTMALVDLAARRFIDKTGEDPRNDLMAAQQLYEDCEKAKRDFARLDKIAITCRYQHIVEDIPVTRDEFESATEGKILQTTMWTEHAVEKAGLTWDKIDRILLVGGSSRLRRMGEALAAVSEKTPVLVGEPDLMVALGAAILAKGKVRPRKRAGGLVENAGQGTKGGLVEVSFKRTTARSLGTRAIVMENGKPLVRNSLIIAHGTQSPVSRSREDYEISYTGQSYFDLPVVEFEDEEDYDQINSYRFHCPPDAVRGDRIRIVFHYDVSGIVGVEATDLKTGAPLAKETVPYEEPDPNEIPMVKANPRWVVFAVDESGSMEGAKMQHAREAVLENARELLAGGGDAVRVGIVSFNARAHDKCQPTSLIGEVERAVSELSPKSTTNLAEGLEHAMAMVSGAPAGTDRDIVVLTDGMPDDRSAALQAGGRIASGGVTLSMLGVGFKDVDEAFLGQLTPIKLVIDQVEGIGGALTNILTQAAKKRAGG